MPRSQAGEPVVTALLLDGFIEFLGRYDADFTECFSDAGISPRAHIDDGPISLNAFAELLHLAARTSGDGCLGLRFGQAYPVGGAGPIGFLLTNAPTLRDAVQYMVRYLPLVVTPLEATFSEDNEGIGTLTWRHTPTLTAPRVQYVSFSVSVVLARFRYVAGADWSPLGIELEHRELPCADLVREVYGERVRFNAGINRMTIDPTGLARTNPRANARLFRALTLIGDQALSNTVETVDIVVRTRRHIQQRLPSGAPDLEAIATSMKLAPRALQWQLSQAGTTFEKVLAETRRQIAETLLKDTDIPLTDIALSLGFSELSSFTRAFKSATGEAPRDFRKRWRQG
jgi:AraC-like DNA-binding protein